MLRPGSVRKAQVPISPVIVMCSVHEDEEVKLLCTNCYVLICSDCVVDQHGGHTFQKIKDIATEKRQQLSTTLDKAERETILEMRTLLEDTTKSKTEQSKNGQTLENTVNGRADFLISEFDKIRKEFIQEVDLLQSGDQKKLDEFVQNMRSISSETEEMVESYRVEMKTCKDARAVQLEIDCKEKLSAFQQKVKSVPKTISSVFVPGPTNKEAIKRLFGRVLDKDTSEAESSSDVVPSQPTGHVIETRLEVGSSFQHETDKGEIKAIATQYDRSAWIATYDCKKIKHVKQTGKVDKTLTFPTKIYDIATNDDGSLLVVPNGGSAPHKYQIKKVKPNGDIVTFVGMKPLRPNCVCISQTGHIYVGCIDGHNYDVTDKNTRCLMKLTDTGIVQQSYRYDDNGQRLFTLPEKIQENVNGDVWVRERTARYEGRIVVLQQDGRVRFIYTGVKNDKIAKDFNPCDLTATGNGTMLVVDINNHIIHVIDGTGTLLYFLGSQHTLGIYGPTAICLDRRSKMLWVGNLKGAVQILHLK